MVVGTEKQGNDGNDSAHVRKREQREETSLLSKLKTNKQHCSKTFYCTYSSKGIKIIFSNMFSQSVNKGPTRRVGRAGCTRGPSLKHLDSDTRASVPFRTRRCHPGDRAALSGSGVEAFVSGSFHKAFVSGPLFLKARLPHSAAPRSATQGGSKRSLFWRFCSLENLSLSLSRHHMWS